MNSLFLAKVDDLLLGKTGVVLDLVDGWDDCGVGEELFKVELGVLFFLFSNGNSGEEGKGGGGGAFTLETPMAFVLPVFSSASICFQVSTWLYPWMMSRLPSGLVGNRSWLPISDQHQTPDLTCPEPYSPSGFISSGQ